MQQFSLQNFRDATKIEKTKFCNSISQGRQCPYGVNCKFAHSEQELRKKPQVDETKFKTRPCENYNKGCCTYGDKCIFIHQVQPQVHKLPKSFPFKDLTPIQPQVQPQILSLDSFPPLKTKSVKSSLPKPSLPKPIDYETLKSAEKLVDSLQKVIEFNEKSIEFKLNALFGINLQEEPTRKSASPTFQSAPSTLQKSLIQNPPIP